MSTDNKTTEQNTESQKAEAKPIAKPAVQQANKGLKSQPGPIKAPVKKPFDELLKAEIEMLEPGMPYIIFRKVENPQGIQNRRGIGTCEVPMVLYLDGCHAHPDTIRRYLKKPGWAVVRYGNLDNQSEEENKRLAPVLEVLEERNKQFEEFRRETGFKGKIESLKHDTKAGRGKASDADDDDDDYEDEE